MLPGHSTATFPRAPRPADRVRALDAAASTSRKVGQDQRIWQFTGQDHHPCAVTDQPDRRALQARRLGVKESHRRSGPSTLTVSGPPDRPSEAVPSVRQHPINPDAAGTAPALRILDQRYARGELAPTSTRNGSRPSTAEAVSPSDRLARLPACSRRRPCIWSPPPASPAWPGPSPHRPIPGAGRWCAARAGRIHRTGRAPVLRRRPGGHHDRVRRTRSGRRPPPVRDLRATKVSPTRTATLGVTMGVGTGTSTLDGRVVDVVYRTREVLPSRVTPPGPTRP